MESMTSEVLKVKIVPKRGRPNTQKELSNEQSEWLTEYLVRQDISRKTPGRKDHVYVGKRIWKINDIMNITNGYDLIDNEDFSTYCETFGERLSFPLALWIFTGPKEYKWNRDIPHVSCTCDM